MSQAPTDFLVTQDPDDGGVTKIEMTTVQSRNQELYDAVLSSHSGAAIPSYAVEGMIWYDTDDDQARVYDGSASFRLTQMRDSAPSSASDTGKAGQWAYDGSFIYICTATDTWLRAAVATW